MEDRIVSKFEDDEDEFRSCCADEEELELGLKNDDEVCVRMLFKGVSISESGNNGLGFSGIGVIMEGSKKVPVIQVQKKLEFFVDEEVADYLALMDGLSEAIQNNIKRVYAFTNSQILFDQELSEEMDDGDAFDCLAENRRWRRCQMCERMIELTHGCYHMTCWCGHEFCYSCGAEYIDDQQTCECASRGDEEENDEITHTPTVPSDPAQQFEEWAWESFGSLSNMMDAYSDQERSQLALIQRFLAGGFSLGDHHTNTYESPLPPCSCAEDDNSSYLDNTIKDLHQLPWLERFVSVISDNYYDEYTQ